MRRRTSPKIRTLRGDGLPNPAWRRAAERIALRDGTNVTLAVVIDDLDGLHGRDHKGRSQFIDRRLVVGRTMFQRRDQA